MTEKPEVKSGQVYKERDSRFVRYVLVVHEYDAARMVCAPCQADGTRTYGGRVTKIKKTNLQTRFQLVKDVL